MEFFSAITAIPVMEGSACALLAAAATVRARDLGAHITGAIVLGILCGLLGPLLRETFLHGTTGSGIVIRALPDDALIGAAGGLAALLITQKFTRRLFIWLDSASIGLASSLGTVMALPELGITGALTLGLINGLLPGLARDMALGDTAMLVDKDWYATTAILGCIAAIAMELWLSVGSSGQPVIANPDSCAVLTGFFAVVIIMSWQARKGIAA